jgi:hypothetical protein
MTEERGIHRALFTPRKMPTLVTSIDADCYKKVYEVIFLLPFPLHDGSLGCNSRRIFEIIDSYRGVLARFENKIQQCDALNVFMRVILYCFKQGRLRQIGFRRRFSHEKIGG